MVRPKFPRSSCKRKTVVDVTSETEYHDRVLVVGDKRFYVVSGILKMWSKYFRKLFSDKIAEEHAEIKLEDVDPDVFEEFLHILYASNPGGMIDNMSAQIELSVRFETPKVIETCKELMNKYEGFKLDEDVFITVCKHNLEDIKKLIIEYVMSHPSLVHLEFLKCSVEYKLDSLVETVGAAIGADTGSTDCAENLDFAFSHNIPTMKKAIMKTLFEWKEEAFKNKSHYYGTAKRKYRPVIYEYDILPLLECAFKYDIEILKSLLRHRIHYCVKTTDNQFNEFKDANVVRHPVTINTFMEAKKAEILTLPKEILEFVIESTVSPI